MSPLASTAEHPVRFAVLQTDRVVESLQPLHSDYPDMFVQLLGDAGISADRIDAYDVQRGEYPAPDAYAGYLITGSKSSVYDKEDWIADLAGFVEAAMAAGSKMVGICFGHQLLAHFFGGRVAAASVGWAVGVHNNSVLAQKPWMQPPAESLSMVSSHKDQVLELPQGAQCIASTPLCPVAGFVIGDTALCLQSHPEYLADFASDFMQLRAEILGPEVLNDGLASLARPLDTRIVGQWIANFLQATPVDAAAGAIHFTPEIKRC